MAKTKKRTAKAKAKKPAAKPKAKTKQRVTTHMVRTTESFAGLRGLTTARWQVKSALDERGAASKRAAHQLARRLARAANDVACVYDTKRRGGAVACYKQTMQGLVRGTRGGAWRRVR